MFFFIPSNEGANTEESIGGRLQLGSSYLMNCVSGSAPYANVL